MEVLDYNGLSHYKDKMLAWLDETKITRTELAFVSKMFKWLNERMDGQKFDVDNDTGTAYALTVPTGAKAVSVNKIGGHSEIRVLGKNLCNSTPYKVGYYIDASGNEQPLGTAQIVEAHVASNIISISLTSTSESTNTYRVHAYDESGNWISQVTTFNAVGVGARAKAENISLPANARIIRVGGAIASEYQIEYGVSATSYEAFSYGIKSASVTDVTSRGKNLLNPEDAVPDYTINASGVIEQNHNCFYYDNYFKINGKMIFSLNHSVNQWRICEYDASKTFLRRIAMNSFNVYRPSSDAVYGKFTAYISDTTVTQEFLEENNPQLEYGEIATPYAPYVGIIGTLSLPEQLLEYHPLHSANAVYDEYNLERKYTVIRTASINLGTLTDIYKDTNWFLMALPNAVQAASGTAFERPLIISKYEAKQISTTTEVIPDKAYWLVNGGNARVTDSDYSTLAEFKASLDGVFAIYALATPIYYYDPTSPELAVNGGTVVPDATHIVDDESYFSDNSIFACEAGGTVTFEQADTAFAVPYDIDLAIKLSEVSI